MQIKSHVRLFSSVMFLFTLIPAAHSSWPGLVCDAVRKESLVGLCGKLCSRSPRHHPHLHGSADQRCHRQPQGKQAEGIRSKSSLNMIDFTADQFFSI